MTMVKTTIRELMDAALLHFFPRERMQPPKKQTMYCYTEGPMTFLAQRIVRKMQDAGYPAKIHCLYRSPERQYKLKANGFSKAGPFESAHGFYLACDIIHPSLAWNVTNEYWNALNECVKIIEKSYGVKLSHGHKWKFKDSAHIQIANWRNLANDAMQGDTPNAAIKKIERGDKTFEDYRPTSGQLDRWFKAVLPEVWNKKHTKINWEKFEADRHKASVNQFIAMAGYQ